MRISINTPDELLKFVKRNDISAKDSLNVFCDAVNVICITFCDAITNETFITKDKVIQETENFLMNIKENPKDKKAIIFY